MKERSHEAAEAMEALVGLLAERLAPYLPVPSPWAPLAPRPQLTLTTLIPLSPIHREFIGVCSH